MTKTGLGFRIFVIVICLIFVICYLEFLILQLSSTPKQLAPVLAKPLNFDLAPRTRFSVLNKVKSPDHSR